FLGRIDGQVKIRGFRIEIGEIQYQLLKLDYIKEAVVVAMEEGNGEKILCAYIVTEKEFKTVEIREALLKNLPDYMIPSYFQKIETLPLTENGKVNTKQLPEPEKKSGEEYVAPRNNSEKKLTGIWAETLEIDEKEIGIDSDFFGLGGHSLKATMVVTMIHKEFNVKVPLVDIFRISTIRELAQYIEKAKQDQYEAIKPAKQQETYSQSSAQKRLYILQEMEPEGIGYNMPGALHLEGEVNNRQLEGAFKRLIRRHESLRTSFQMKNGEFVQKIHENVPFEIRGYEIEGAASEWKDEIKRKRHEFIKPFDLATPPLIRAALVKISPRQHLLIYDIHHIVTDGISAGILAREFSLLYEGKEPPRMTLQYKDYSQWQNEMFETGAIKPQKQYWAQQYSTPPPALEMPLDYERPQKKTFEGDAAAFTITAETAGKLERLAEDNEVTMNILLFSIYNILLNKMVNQEEIVVGSLVAGRNYAGLENIIGMFVNYLPLKTVIDKNQPFTKYLENSKQAILQAYDNQDYPFEKIVEDLDLEPEMGRNPLFDTVFSYHNEQETRETLAMEGVNFSSFELEVNASTVDFKVDVYWDPAADTHCYIQYDTNLFKKETMENVARKYQALLEMILEKPQQPIADIELFTPREQTELEEKRERNREQQVEKVQLVVSSTFSDQLIEEYVRYWGSEYDMEIELRFTPYNQVFQELLKEDGMLSENTGINLLLVRFEDWLRDDQLSDGERCEKLGRNFDQITALLRSKPREAPYFAGVFPVARHMNYSPRITEYIEEMNTRWKEMLETTPGIYVIDFTKMRNYYEMEEEFDPIKDREAHMPFSDEYYAAMGTMIARKIHTYKKNNYKVIALDIDNTIWKGIVGEDGIEGINVTAPYKELQKFMLEKYEEGMLLTLCSKNNEDDVWQAFEKNPEMQLKKEHFAAWRINWKLKSQNLKEIARELNLSPKSIIFLDDNPAECLEVETNAPEILVLELPAETTEIPGYLKQVWEFDRLKVTEEDKNRNMMYSTEKERKEAAGQMETLEKFLEGLQLKIKISPLTTQQVPRFAQLTQRTNQFNLSTIRRSETQIKTLLEDENHTSLVVEARDRFGDYGIVGGVIVKKKQDHYFIDTFLLSCRILGKTIEDAILIHLQELCQEEDVSQLKAKFYPTSRNIPFREFIESTSWEKLGNAEEYLEYEIPLEKIAALSTYADFEKE
ncbi:MAG: HAD-IIIC family phosphatase, partial [bacterium]|nr:HAD-IIIC family phosphatase [bacterium]